MVSTITEVANAVGLFNNFSEASEQMAGLTGQLQGVAQVVSALNSGFSTFTEVLSIAPTITSLVKALTLLKNPLFLIQYGLQAIKTAILTNPIGIFVAVLAGLGAMFFSLYQSSETFRNAVNAAFTQIRDLVMPIIQVVVDFITSIWGTLVLWWQENSQMILTTAMTIWNAIWTTISSIVQSIWGFVKQIWTTLTTFWNEHGQKIKEASSNIFKAIWSVIELYMNYIKSIIEVVWPVIQAIFKSALNIITTVVSGAWNMIKTIVQGFVDWFLSVIEFWSSVFTGDWEGALNAAKDSAKAVLDTITGVFGNALDFVMGLGGDFIEAGKNIVGSIAEGIKTAVGKVTSAISGVTERIRNFLPFSPAKEGALRDIMKIQIPQSIAKSIDKGRSSAVKAMSGLSNAIYEEMPQVDIGGRVASINSQLGKKQKLAVKRNVSGSSGGINQTVNIYSPTPLSPSETARQQKKASRQLAMKWGI
ncbi:hypothetical protein Pryu01_02775 [Paraliobacillus ryukyuensis]|uniref:Phage-related protein n=1 Tax=Paraliobacillus ryukyuensis TaxID=200904 RepID=A0A366DTH7_9BACI|nr:hypothetical protein [Paraliobacillus ryukyuensis]RBO93215.1 hypothetical protein DES48_11216 [Paraliobacillus ryukyuensis]